MRHRRMEEGSGMGWEGKLVRRGTHLWPPCTQLTMKGEESRLEAEDSAL